MLRFVTDPRGSIVSPGIQGIRTLVPGRDLDRVANVFVGDQILRLDGAQVDPFFLGRFDPELATQAFNLGNSLEGGLRPMQQSGYPWKAHHLPNRRLGWK